MNFSFSKQQSFDKMRVRVGTFADPPAKILFFGGGRAKKRLKQKGGSLGDASMIIEITFIYYPP